METFSGIASAPPETIESLLALQRESRQRLEGEKEDSASWFDTQLELIFDGRWTGFPQPYAELLLHFVQWYFKEGRLQESQRLASKAVSVCRRADLQALLRRSLNLLGAAYTQDGDLSQATVCYVEALQIADKL